MKRLIVGVSLVLLFLSCPAFTASRVSNDPCTVGAYKPIVDTRFRSCNFQRLVSGTYGNVFDIQGETEKILCTRPFYNQGAWATENDFTVTYTPDNSVSLQMAGIGTILSGDSGNYDVAVLRAHNAVVSLVKFELFDRNPFPTFHGLNLNNVGMFSLTSVGSGDWAVIDTYWLDSK